MTVMMRNTHTPRLFLRVAAPSQLSVCNQSLSGSMEDSAIAAMEEAEQPIEALEKNEKAMYRYKSFYTGMLTVLFACKSDAGCGG
jgi:hypothetical protein